MKTNAEKAQTWIQPKIYIATSIDILKDDARNLSLADFNKKYKTNQSSEENLRAKINQTFNWLKKSKNPSDKIYSNAFQDAWKERAKFTSKKKIPVTIKITPIIPPVVAPVVPSIPVGPSVVSPALPPGVSTGLFGSKYPKSWSGSFPDGTNVIKYVTNVNYYENAAHLHIFSAQCDYTMYSENTLVLRQQYEICKQYIYHDPAQFTHHRIYLEVRNQKGGTTIGTKFAREDIDAVWDKLDDFFYPSLDLGYKYEGFTFEITNYKL